MSAPRSSPSGRGLRAPDSESTPASSARSPGTSSDRSSDRLPAVSSDRAPPAPSDRAPASNDALEPAFAILTRYVSPPTARSILGLAQQRGGAAGATDLRQLLDRIEHSLRLFLNDPVQVRRCRAALDELADAQPKSNEAVVVHIRSEEDIVKARIESRRIATQVGFSTVGLTRLMTAVSELARNIVLYAGQGQVEVTPTGSPRGVEVIARDRGPGIRDLDQILAGNYKSKLGMGLGLRAVKKIADQFDVQTAPGTGTTVRFVLRVT